MYLDKLIELIIVLFIYFTVIYTAVPIVSYLLKQFWNVSDDHVIHHDKYLL